MKNFLFTFATAARCDQLL